MLECLWTNAAKMAVASDSIVEHFHTVEDVRSRERARAIVSSSDSLIPPAARERFSDCVVPAVTAAAPAGVDFVDFAEAKPVTASVL
jgi:hypothetical protein